jgi:hypothetical protein
VIVKLPIVKLERLLKVPRSGRTIQLVINIPEPPAPPAMTTPPPQLTGWARAWAVLKVAGPATVATAAIIISILSLQRQGSANRDLQEANAITQQENSAAGATRQRQDAEKVSFLQNALPPPPFTFLLVENLCITPIYNVTFQVEASILIGLTVGANGRLKYTGFESKTFTFWLGNIPACSSGTASVVPAVVATLMKNKVKLTALQITGEIGIITDWMSFADSNGVAWRYSGIGGLQQLQYLPANTYTPNGYMGATYKDAVGCT